ECGFGIWSLLAMRCVPGPVTSGEAGMSLAALSCVLPADFVPGIAWASSSSASEVPGAGMVMVLTLRTFGAVSMAGSVSGGVSSLAATTGLALLPGTNRT